ncbi:MAG TPA: 16S rRNA (guanine(527)-N(7))-methyltransferase RsmG [Candidatus Dormibacteraeota bacterium]|nr:16S rRNA (guanine(527)-N(7))-methyltransferase RsmG [Candidatus Dormibacteraeota bacterium]
MAKNLEPYGIRPTDAQCELIRRYVALLLKWNRSISLTTITNETEILKFHFGESSFALQAVDGIKNGRLADVGAGAGFPGLAIRIFAPDLELALIEANAKKCAFLAEVVRELDLKGVRVVRSRFEDSHESSDMYETVVARALGAHDDLLTWARGSLIPSGRIALWLGTDDAREIATIGGWKWLAPIPIPGSQRRLILTGSPDRDSPQ